MTIYVSGGLMLCVCTYHAIMRSKGAQYNT